MNQPFDRQSEIARLRRELVRDGFPRLKMLLIVTLTGGSGFFASFLLLHSGVHSMTARYPAAVGIAYLVFLFLLWLWLRTSAEDYSDVPDFSSSSSSRHSECASDTPAHVEAPLPDDADVLGDVAGSVAQAEEFAIPLLALLALAALLFSSLWIVYTAPVLFAELLVDGVLATTLYRRLRGITTQHWLETAIRRTALPFFLTAIVVSLAGAGMHHLVPTAKSVGEVLASRAK